METGRAGNQTHSEKLAFKSMLHSAYSSLNYFFFFLELIFLSSKTQHPTKLLPFLFSPNYRPYICYFAARESLVPHSLQGHAGCQALTLLYPGALRALAQAAFPLSSPRADVWSESEDNNTFCSLGQSAVCTD